MSDTATTRAWLRGLGAGVAFLAAALVVSRVTSSWIALAFPDRPVAPDLLFDTLPHVPKGGYIADLAVVAALVLLLVYAFRGNQRELPVMMTLIAVMYILRGFINVLTPLGSPLRGSTYYGIGVVLERALGTALIPLMAPLQNAAYSGVTVSNGIVHASQNGEFPSGHMAVVFLCMLLVDKVKAPRIRAALAVLVVVEAASLLMSHQHYSIDVVGGLLLSYFIYYEYAEGTLFNWLKPLVTV